MQKYGPTTDLLEGIRRAFPLPLLPWDDYFLRMAEQDFLAGKAGVSAAKSYFVRKAPFGGSYMILGGITAALRIIKDLPLDDPEFQKCLRYRGYREEFVTYLASFGRLKGVTVYAPQEGSVFFPNEPIVSITGPLAQLRLVDGLLISELNFPSLSMTKWHRLVRAVRPGNVLDFSRRRSQDSMRASFYGVLAGCTATSNMELGRFFDIPVKGTMGHEGPQSEESVARYFDQWLTHHPGLPIGLVDTVRCMEVDFPAWLDAVYAHREQIKAANPPVWGWRNDSGDLARLAIDQYRLFLRHSLARDDWFADRMRMWLTNELDEYSSTSIIAQISTQMRSMGRYDDLLSRVIWAAGTRPGVCVGDPAIGGVMKLMEIDGKPCIKLALNESGEVSDKTSLPGFNLSGLVRDNRRDYVGLLIFPAYRYEIRSGGQLFDKVKNHLVTTLDAVHPNSGKTVFSLNEYTIELRQRVVFQDGDFAADWHQPSISDVQAHALRETDMLPWYVTRLEQPQIFTVAVTPDLYELRQRMIHKGALQMEYNHF